MSRRVGWIILGLFLIIATACKRQPLPLATVVQVAEPSESHPKVAYHTVENELGTIYLIDLETKDAIRLTARGEGAVPYFSFSPDGQRLVYVATTRSKPADIYVVNLDGTEKKRLTKTSTLEVAPTWSPDGQRIAFVSPHEDGVEKVFVVQPDGDGMRRLTKESEIITLLPDWSPDSDKIVCMSLTAAMAESGARDVRIVDVESGETLRHISNGYYNHAPKWSPDGSRLAYISNKQGSFDIYILDLASQTERRLTGLESDILTATWSPLGDRIAFVIEAAGHFEIGAVMTDGSNLTLLTVTDANDAWPSWSPDGSQIAFFSDRDSGQVALYVMKADGSEQTYIRAKTSRAISSPIWLPHPEVTPAIADLTPQTPPTPTATLLPQSQRIAFVSGQENEADIYIWDLSTRQVGRLTDNNAPDVWPRWSPDGRRLLFMCSDGDNWDLCVMNADGSELRRLIDTRNTQEYFPAWSPSGHWAAYVEDIKEETNDKFGVVFGLTVVDVDTRIRRQVLTQSVMRPLISFWCEMQ